MTSVYLDAHCHLDRYQNPADVIAASAKAGVSVLAMTERPTGFQRLRAQLRGTQGFRPALGFHPLAEMRHPALELNLFAKLAPSTQFIGEVGLDFSRRARSSRTVQMKTLERLLQTPKIDKKVLSVHSRAAERETLSLLSGTQALSILHWYSGPVTLVEHALEGGCYFSVNSAMARTEKGQRIIRALPISRVLTETDGPFVRSNGQVVQPKDIPHLISLLAAIWSRDTEEVAAALTETKRQIPQLASL